MVRAAVNERDGPIPIGGVGDAGGWVFRAPERARPPESSDAGPSATFSVIVAVYNVADLVGEALASAFAQTVPAHEVIVVDDGSTDDVDAALEPFLERIRLIRQPNSGEGAAKNAAVEAATGDFVVILDADDVDHPRRLEALGALARERPDLDVLATDADLVEDGRVIRQYYTDWHTFEVDDQRSAILQRNWIFNPAIRRERYLDVGGFDPGLWGTADWECCIRLLLSGSRAGLVDAPLVQYRQRPGRLTGARIPLLEGRVHALEKTLCRPELTDAERVTLDESLRAARRRLATEARRRGSAEAARSAARAIVRDPGSSAGARLRACLTLLAPHLARSLDRRREAPA